LFGFTVRLSGASAAAFRCSYDATFADGSCLQDVPAGEDCATRPLSSLVAMTIRLVPRPLEEQGQ
jgi:hypothetical protein